MCGMTRPTGSVDGFRCEKRTVLGTKNIGQQCLSFSRHRCFHNGVSLPNGPSYFLTPCVGPRLFYGHASALRFLLFYATEERMLKGPPESAKESWGKVVCPGSRRLAGRSGFLPFLLSAPIGGARAKRMKGRKPVAIFLRSGFERRMMWVQYGALFAAFLTHDYRKHTAVDRRVPFWGCYKNPRFFANLVGHAIVFVQQRKGLFLTLALSTPRTISAMTF